MASIQLDSTGRYTMGIPAKLAKSLGIEKGDTAHVMKGDRENELRVILERV